MGLTEKEWLEAHHPLQMLEMLYYRTSSRKLRLIACACCRRIWDYLVDPRSRSAVEMAELYVDGEHSEEDRKTFANAAHDACFELRTTPDSAPEDMASFTAADSIAADEDFHESDDEFTAVWDAVYCTVQCKVYAVIRKEKPKSSRERTRKIATEVEKQEFAAQAKLIREIIGNPFAKPHIGQHFLNATVIKVAQVSASG